MISRVLAVPAAALLATAAPPATALAANQTLAFTARHVSSKGHVEKETDINAKGKVIGHDVLTCRTTGVKDQSLCTALFRLTSPKRGSITVRVKARFTDKVQRGTVTGGTGTYAGAKGTVAVTPKAHGRTEIVIKIT